jgi:hypothetical protein
MDHNIRILKLSPWERILFSDANSGAVSQQNPQFSWNTKNNFTVNKSCSLDPVLSHMNSVHIFTRYVSEIHFNVIML